ncbi:hypothetical protein [Salinilacihabitans rarus]|uniref:hypothetical protein n=1 Tax=Salinilacihabitans rarus TaxID=2961596 RepID=UPI0020C912E1|nr:hypothetical protein [Salinilacihabitans rarus]
MVDSTLHLASVPFALVAGTAAGVLSWLWWTRRRNAPFAAGVALLAGSMAFLTAAHALLLVEGAGSPLVEGLESATYTGLAAFVLALAARERFRRAAPGR